MNKAIVEICIDDLRPGILAERFKDGAAAVIITGDESIRRAWELLIHDPSEQLPWQAPLIDIARNHLNGENITEILGDMYYLKPGRHAQIARKIELVRDPGDERIVCHPAAFHQDGNIYAPDPDTLDHCWKISEQIMQAIKPAAADMPPYRAVVQRLKYQEHAEDNKKLFALAQSSLGRWGQIGYAIDGRREVARGALAPWGICDLFALLSLISPLRGGLDALNRICARRARQDDLADDEDVIQKAHCDSRFFSGLCGLRNNVRTDVAFENRWVEVPVGLESIVVIPGKLAEVHFGIPPVLHRVIQGDSRTNTGEPSPNVTLLFGAK